MIPFEILSNLPSDFILNHEYFKKSALEILSNGKFLKNGLMLISNFTLFWSESIITFPSFEIYWHLFLWHHMWSNVINVSCALENLICSC